MPTPPPSITKPTCPLHHILESRLTLPWGLFISISPRPDIVLLLFFDVTTRILSAQYFMKPPPLCSALATWDCLGGKFSPIADFVVYIKTSFCSVRLNVYRHQTSDAIYFIASFVCCCCRYFGCLTLNQYTIHGRPPLVTRLNGSLVLCWLADNHYSIHDIRTN